MEALASMRSHKILFFSTLAFTVCFAAWMQNGVLVTFLIDNQVFDWSPVQFGWLMGIPVLTGALFRLPAGILTDKYGGKPVYGSLLILNAIPMFFLSTVDSFLGFALCSFGFGFTGVSFAIGIAFSSVWYPKERQGTALGIFGAGNAGAALTTLFAPTLLNHFTDNATNLEGWRTLPIVYAVALLGMGILFFIFTNNKKPASSNRSFKMMMMPLKDIRVWRFGLYYFLVFGMFVAFAQWLVPYFVSVYTMPLVSAALFASLFSLPSGLIRALGGWMSDKFSARTVMKWVLGISVFGSLMLIVPRMDIYSPGRGIMAKAKGIITEVTPEYIKVDDKKYNLVQRTSEGNIFDDKNLILPVKDSWHEVQVKVGEEISKKQLLAKGISNIYFQANIWVFVVIVILLGSTWGIGKAAVYKFIPDYFPEEVGVVGGMVGVIGGLGGFVGPVIFGYLLEYTGLWTSCWMFIFFVSLVSLWWMNRVSHGIVKKEAPEALAQVEEKAR